MNRTVFFLGWLLSPFTFWNDAFVNVPLSYICANLFVRIIPIDFITLVLVFYWLGNILGIAMMYLSGKHIIKERGKIRELGKLVLTMMFYSIALIVLHRAGILKPLVIKL